MRAIRALSLGLCLTFGLMLLGCGASYTAEEEALRADGTYSKTSPESYREELNLPIEPVSLERCHPLRASSIQENLVTQQLYEGLLRYEAGGQKVLRVAERIERQADGKTYRIELKKDRRWSDASLVQAGDFVETWKARLRSQAKLMDQDKLLWIKGASEFVAGQEGELGLRLLDEWTFDLELERPFERFEEWLASTAFLPSKVGKDQEPLYNGAFWPSPTGAPQGVSLRLERQPQAVEQQMRQIKAINFYTYPTAIEAYEAFRRGEVDLMGLPFVDVPLERRASAAKEGAYQSLPSAQLRVIEIQKDSLFSDAELRPFLAYALEPKFMADVVRNDESEALLTLPAKTSEQKAKWKMEFDQLLEAKGIDKAELAVSALAPEDALAYRELLSSVKEWIDLYGFRVRLSKRIEPEEATFKLRDLSFGTSQVLDAYRLLNPERYATMDDMILMGAIQTEWPNLPLYQLHWPTLVASSIRGYDLNAQQACALETLLIEP